MKNIKIILTGSPLSTGGVYKTMCRGNFPKGYMTNQARALKEDYQWQAKSQWMGKPLTEPLTIDVKIYFKTLRKADWDNFHKLSMDALTGIVWADDSQIIKATVEKCYDPKNPRIEITIL